MGPNIKHRANIKPCKNIIINGGQGMLWVLIIVGTSPLNYYIITQTPQKTLIDDT